ncbi:MAG: ADP-ribosylglycohydrolase family protein [Chthoniobacterales bacterium]
MPLPKDYLEKVYAGILGKIIGVYLGRPFEGWTHDRILRELGPVRYYVHERMGKPLVVIDDDISGTFTFLRALPDFGNTEKITPVQIGHTWLNYIIENRTILWWGGFGNSTEHTAFVRLNEGIDAPRSGSIELNGKIIAQQIGAQIFIDGWAMVAPGKPKLAFELAGKAAKVSHDGEAVLAAQLLAVMEAQAFVEPDMNRLFDLALSFLPPDSLVTRLVTHIRSWHAEQWDWKETRARIEQIYGYEKYGGNCHIIPNCAIVLLSLLYGEDDFATALTIANTSGWDTDCNSGNAGCLMGIKNGLKGIDAGPDWRGPVADRMLVSSADGSRSISDAVREAYEIYKIGSALDQAVASVLPKNGARFHFELPGSVQGFEIDPDEHSATAVRLFNVEGESSLGDRTLAIQFEELTQDRSVRVATRTFMSLEEAKETHYTLMASPTLFPGQTVRAGIKADAKNDTAVRCTLYVSAYDRDDRVVIHRGPALEVSPGETAELVWKIADLRGAPIAKLGVEVTTGKAVSGIVYLDYVDWVGTPDTKFRRVDGSGQMWFRAWVNAIDVAETRWPEAFHLSQSCGTGLFIMGGSDWRDYVVTSTITPRVARSFGLAARLRGLRRYYAFLAKSDQTAQIVRRCGETTVLGETTFPWEFERPYEISLEVAGTEVAGAVNGAEILRVLDRAEGLESGGFGFVCEEGLILSDEVRVRPIPENL